MHVEPKRVIRVAGVIGGVSVNLAYRVFFDDVAEIAWPTALAALPHKGQHVRGRYVVGEAPVDIVVAGVAHTMERDGRPSVEIDLVPVGA